MKKDYSQIDKLFAKRLAHRRKELPPHIWDSIEHTLDRKKKVIPLWFRWLAAAAVLFLVFQLGYEWARFSDSNDSTPSGAKLASAPYEGRSRHSAVAEKISSGNTVATLSGEHKPALNGQAISGNTAKPVHRSVRKHTGAKKESAGIVSRPAETVKKRGFLQHFSALKAMEIAGIPVKNMSPGEIHFRKIAAFAIPQLGENAGERVYSYTGAKKKTPRRFAVGLSVAPSYASRDIRPLTVEGAVVEEHFDRQENGIPEYAANIQFSYKANDRFSIHAGIAYNTFGFQDTEPLNFALKGDVYHLKRIENAVAHYAISKDVRGQIIEKISAFRVENKSEEEVMQGVLTQQFSYVQFPVSVGFRLVRTRSFTTELTGGISPGYLVNEHTGFTFDGVDIPLQEYEAYNTKILGGLFGFAVNYRIGRHLNFTMQPLLNYSFSSVIQNPDYHVRPYSWNLFGGVHYLF